MDHLFHFFSLLSLLLVLLRVQGERPTEEERAQLWRQTNTWPPRWQPETPAMRQVLAAREAEIMALTGSDERWENWLQFTQNRLVPSFTERGFQVVQTPAKVHAILSSTLNQALKNFDAIPTEGNVDVIYNPPHFDPKFVRVGSMKDLRDIQQTLLPLHEQWAGGIKLKPTSAYGIRLYLNGSSLVMHYDRVSE